VRIDEADALVSRDSFGQLGDQLQNEKQVRIFSAGKKTFIHRWKRTAELLRQARKDVPGDSVILAIWVAETDDQCSWNFHSLKRFTFYM
jgi:hypothetical protein